MSDYTEAQKLGLTTKNRWEDGIEHHPMSLRLMEFIEEHDYEDMGDTFCWKTGGDGDNGESLMYEMDAFFELLDAQQAQPGVRAKKAGASVKKRKPRCKICQSRVATADGRCNHRDCVPF